MKNEGFNPVRSSTKQGTGSRALDMYYVYKMAKFLVLPWTEWEAYRLGIIDDKGNLLKKKAQRTLSTEKENTFSTITVSGLRNSRYFPLEFETPILLP